MSNPGRNREILESRWPGLWEELEAATPPGEVLCPENKPEPSLIIDGLHLTSLYNRRSEAEALTRSLPPDSPVVWVYGFALGDVPRLLLERGTRERVTVVILSPGVTYQSMCRFDHSDILKDPRLELVLGSRVPEEIQRPFVAVPVCLRFVPEEIIPLRDLLILELGAAFEQEFFRSLEREFDTRILENRHFCEKDGDVADLFDTRPLSSAVVAAAGPTMSHQFSWLRAQRDDKVLIATNTALMPLQKAGLHPDAVVIIDYHEWQTRHFEQAAADPLRDVPLVYLPTVYGGALRLWPGPRLTAYVDSPRFLALHREIPKGFLFCSGTVTHAAVDLAVKMGSREVILLGADFSYPMKKSYVEGVALEGKASGTSDTKGEFWVPNGQGKPVLTNTRFIGFLRDLESYIEKHPQVRFINTGREGAMIRGTEWLDGT